MPQLRSRNVRVCRCLVVLVVLRGHVLVERRGVVLVVLRGHVLVERRAVVLVVPVGADVALGRVVMLHNHMLCGAVPLRLLVPQLCCGQLLERRVGDIVHDLLRGDVLVERRGFVLVMSIGADVARRIGIRVRLRALRRLFVHGRERGGLQHHHAHALGCEFGRDRQVADRRFLQQ